jgi:hypothetical protein
MLTLEKQNAAMDMTDKMHHWGTRLGAKSYETPTGNYVLWIPWRHEVVNLADTKAVGHAMVMAGYMPSTISWRAFIVNDFIVVSKDAADEIKNAPLEVKSKTRTMRLY